MKILLTLLVCFVICKADVSADEQLYEALEALQNLAASNQEAMAEQFEELKHFMKTNFVERQIHIEEMLSGIIRRQRMYHFCHEKPCGEHGECYVQDDVEDFLCECEAFWTGKDCTVSNPCHHELYNMQYTPLMLGQEMPFCDEEGFYQGMQYAGSKAICVDREGNRLGYEVDRWEAGEEMTCECARDEDAELKNILPPWEVEERNCTANGNYP